MKGIERPEVIGQAEGIGRTKEIGQAEGIERPGMIGRPKMINLSINGRDVQCREGTTILAAALSLGIAIPRLCHHPAISAQGVCRLCVVEVEGSRRLPASCTTPAAEGMKVQTESAQVVMARRMILDLLLANHRVECLTCEKNGDCQLQDYAYQYGVSASSFPGAQREYRPDDTNPFFERDHSKCILCGRCVMVCAEKVCNNVYDLGYRGFDLKIVAGFDKNLEESPCVFCGNCITLCPTGALQPKLGKGAGRVYDKEQVRTICPYCGVGCALNLQLREGKIVGVEPANGPADRNLLCVKGRFGWDFIEHPDRLTKPLIRRDGELVETTWEEALAYTAARLKAIKEKYGADAIGGMSSSKCTNEENYLMQKFMRACLGTNNVDNSARLCHASTITGLSEAFGSGAATNSLAELDHAKAFFIIGSNTTETHPVISFRLQQALRRGTKLIVADPRRTDLAEKADLYLQPLPGSDVALLNGMLRVIICEGLTDNEFIAARTEGFAALKDAVMKYTPEYTEAITGVPAEDLAAAARMYAQSGSSVILYAMGITQHTSGTDNVQSVANLAMATGNVGRESTGVYPLRGQNNVQGSCDMGALPIYYPGYQKVSDEKARRKFEGAWGVPLPVKDGLSEMEMIDAAVSGELKAIYIIGENPMMSNPDISYVERGLKNLDFLVVQDIFPTETTRLADVVLPGVTFAEKEGTFSNTERRVQKLTKAIEPVGESRADWEIICRLAELLGYPQKYDSAAEIMREIAALTPSYGGITYERLGLTGLQWPCPDSTHPGTRFLHQKQFSRGLGRFKPTEFQPSAELPDEEYPLIFVTGRHLYHYHTGTMTRRSQGLEAHRPEPYVEVNPETAARLGISDGEMVRAESRRGAIELKAALTERIPARIIFVPFHYTEAAANLLTNKATDAVSQIPEFKVCAARLEKRRLAEE